MKHLILALVTLTSIAPFVRAADKEEHFNLIHVKDLVTMQEKKDTKVAILDANNAETRQKDGIIPGARLLSSSKSYDLAKELPADKDTALVFYCANVKCQASHAAASRAVDAGYPHVSVMSDGIQGWAKAGRPVEKP